ncbi:MAG: DUF4935 domain-containing protein [Bacteroidales bacterium]|nr:DUF4935 domain-containing protein [Bacteroidales bacterium]
MRNSFYEYYGLTKEEHERLWDKALLVLDTNVLLSLYRLQSEARKDILTAISKYKDRLWMPFQVGYEYHEHRLEEACRPIDTLQKLQERVESFVRDIEKDFGKHPYLHDFKNIKKTLTTLSEKVSKLTKESINACPDFVHGDSILDELTELYEGKVGNPYSEERLAEIYKIGEARYDKDIPPGYKDKNKKTSDRHRFGDLIIWYQMMEKSKESDCDILFVTDDQKEDWWQIHSGDKIGARRELIAEFRSATGNHLLGIYTPDRFLSTAKERKTVSVKPTTIEEVKYSDLAKLGMESLFGESYTPGQFAIGSLLVDPYSNMAESSIGQIPLSSMLDEDNPLLGINYASPVRRPFAGSYEKTGLKSLVPLGFNPSPIGDTSPLTQTIKPASIVDPSTNDNNENMEESDNNVFKSE